MCVTSWNRLCPQHHPDRCQGGGNYISSQLISREAKRNGFAEGLALDVNGYLSEGAGENLFLVKNGVVHPARHRRHPVRHHPRHHHDAGARLGLRGTRAGAAL